MRDRSFHLRAPGVVRILLLAVAACAATVPVRAADAVKPAEGNERLEAVAREVEAVERSFAQTMADRDLGAFSALVAGDAVFRGEHSLLVGREAVVDGWRSLFAAGPAPFSWEPDKVTVSQSGDTALSTGPVFDRDGKRIARFTSIWRRQAEADGLARWRIIVDQGVPIDACK